MNSLTTYFSSLNISKRHIRTLVGYADTEGAPHRNDGKSSLWNMAIIFKHVVDNNSYKILEECFHVTHFAMPKKVDKHLVSKPFKTHLDTIDHLKKEHDCDRICLCFWNAPHDNAVLRYYDALGNFDTVDLLRCARDNSTVKYKSFSIGDLSKEFNFKSSSLHTGLGDTLRMIKILPKVGIESPEKMSQYINRTNTKSSTVKNVEKNNIINHTRNLPTNKETKTGRHKNIVANAIEKARRTSKN